MLTRLLVDSFLQLTSYHCSSVSSAVLPVPVIPIAVPSALVLDAILVTCVLAKPLLVAISMLVSLSDWHVVHVGRLIALVPSVIPVLIRIAITCIFIFVAVGLVLVVALKLKLSCWWLL